MVSFYENDLGDTPPKGLSTENVSILVIHLRKVITEKLGDESLDFLSMLIDIDRL